MRKLHAWCVWFSSDGAGRRILHREKRTAGLDKQHACAELVEDRAGVPQATVHAAGALLGQK